MPNNYEKTANPTIQRTDTYYATHSVHFTIVSQEQWRNEVQSKKKPPFIHEIQLQDIRRSNLETVKSLSEF